MCVLLRDDRKQRVKRLLGGRDGNRNERNSMMEIKDYNICFVVTDMQWMAAKRL